MWSKTLIFLGALLYWVYSCNARLTTKQVDITTIPHLMANLSTLVRVTRTPINSTVPVEVPKRNARKVGNGTLARQNKDVLVKKPIPKFNDFEYDEEFQSKVAKVKAVDSNEYEDEDFSFGDYEFDVHHDEFVSGRNRMIETRIRPPSKPNHEIPRQHKTASNASPKDGSKRSSDSNEKTKDKHSKSGSRTRKAIEDYYDTDAKSLSQRSVKTQAKSSEDKSVKDTKNKAAPTVTASSKSKLPK